MRCTVLSASDPCRDRRNQRLREPPGSRAGLATSTSAGIELVEKLSGIKALNFLDRSSLTRLRAILKDTLDF